MNYAQGWRENRPKRSIGPWILLTLLLIATCCVNWHEAVKARQEAEHGQAYYDLDGWHVADCP